MTLFPLHAKTLSGLEQVLAAELTELGATDVQPGHRLVTFSGDQRLMYLANLGCRTAIRILKPIANFPADSERALYAGVQQIDWSRFLDPDRSLAIDPVVWSSFCTHSLFVAQLSKDAIVDQFRDRTGRRPRVDLNEPDLRINIHLVENVATVYLDSSGDSLHRRCNRAKTGDAPLGEVLAAGILRLTEWDRQSTLLDPMCGSGTFCIEAALLARNMAPGVIRRRFGFQAWKDYDQSLRDTLLAELRRGELPSLPFSIVGSDIDAEVVAMARENARRAGVAADVRFETANAECCQGPTPTGTLVMNPPYDERLKVDQIASFYRRIGDTFKQRFAGYTAWVFTGNLDAAKQIGLRPSRKVRLFNGPIECRLLRFDLYSGTRRTPADAATPESAEEAAAAAQEATVESSLGTAAAEIPGLPVQVQVEPFSVPPRWRDQATMFRNRLDRMGKHWRKWARRQGITCFRLYDRDIPDVPLVIDWYEGQLHVAEFVRPHDRSEAEHRVWLDFIVRAAAEALGVDPDSQTYLKRRERQRGKSQYERQDDAGEMLEVREGGHKFLVNLSDYLDTGLFLDHRQTRALVEAEAAGKRFVNLFGYTGSFTVYAAAGGAASTTTVDLSNTYLHWSQQNMRLNGFTGAAHQFVRDDAVAFLRHRAARHEPRFDLAVVDPPTFSNSKRLADVWDIQQHHAELLNLLLEQMTPGGKIYFSTNLRRFKLYEDTLRHVTLREITAQTIPPDFRNKRIHRCWTLVSDT
jgi:23S rRNA (guanine2445-N2)-methyltransferase / 23S rRNA (guanine2069-N7)-methyltransferase